MKPTPKAPAIAQFLEQVAGRTTSIEDNRCIAPPIGCGKKIVVTEFRNQISLKEYRISGMCQACQDSVFGPDEPGEN